MGSDDIWVVSGSFLWGFNGFELDSFHLFWWRPPEAAMKGRFWVGTPELAQAIITLLFMTIGDRPEMAY